MYPQQTLTQFANSMIYLLLARFITNDLPHAAGLLKINPGSNKGLRTIIREKLKQETEWGEEQYGKKQWSKEDWGKIEGGLVTLFHGTWPYNIPRIIKEGLLAGYDVPPEEWAEDERFEKAVWFGVTPYLAFFFGDVCVKARVPLDWIDQANDGVLVDRSVPPSMILEVKEIDDWE